MKKKNLVSTILLQDAIELISGRDLQKSQYNAEEKGIPYIMGASNIKNGNFIIERWTDTPTVIGKKEDIILSVKGTVGEFFILDEEEVHLSRQVMALRVKSGYINKYIKYFLAFYIEKLKEKAKGMIPGITREDILLAQIPDFGLEMQEKVINILNLSESIINKRKAQIEALDQLTQGLFLEMFGNPITNPKGWDISSCKGITNKIGSGATPKGGNASYKDDGISLIRSMNVYNNRFSYKDLAYIDEDQAEKLNNVEVYKNDVLLNITGASVARSCIVPNDILPARVNQHVSIIRGKDNLVNFIFLNYLFTNEFYQKYLWQIATSGGATREAITKQQIEKLPIILPPLYLQNDFASKVEQIEKQKSLMRSSILELENMYNTLLQKAFKGELFNEEKVANF